MQNSTYKANLSRPNMNNTLGKQSNDPSNLNVCNGLSNRRSANRVAMNVCLRAWLWPSYHPSFERGSGGTSQAGFAMTWLLSLPMSSLHDAQLLRLQAKHNNNSPCSSEEPTHGIPFGLTIHAIPCHSCVMYVRPAGRCAAHCLTLNTRNTPDLVTSAPAPALCAFESSGKN